MENGERPVCKLLRLENRPFCTNDAARVQWLMYADFPFFICTVVAITIHWHKRRARFRKWERRICIYDITWVTTAVVYNVTVSIHAKCVGSEFPISSFVCFQSCAVISFGLRMDFVRGVLKAIMLSSRLLFDSLMVVAIFIYIFAIYFFAELSKEVITEDVGELEWFSTMSNSIHAMFLIAMKENGEIPEYLWTNNRTEQVVLYFFMFTVALILMEFLSANSLEMMQAYMEERRYQEVSMSHSASRRENTLKFFEDHYCAGTQSERFFLQMYVVGFLFIHYFLMMLCDSFGPEAIYSTMEVSSTECANISFIVVNMVEVAWRFARGSLKGIPLLFTVLVVIGAVTVEVTDTWHPEHLPKSTAVLTLRIFDLMLHLSPVRSVVYAMLRVSDVLGEAVICTFFVLYFFACVGYILWGQSDDEGLQKWFNSPQSSLFAMYLLLGMELGEIPTDLHTYSPYTCFFYVPYIVIVSLVFTNVMVGVLIAGIALGRRKYSEHEDARLSFGMDSFRDARSDGNAADIMFLEMPLPHRDQPPSQDVMKK